jgi:hypothetical protein
VDFTSLAMASTSVREPSSRLCPVPRVAIASWLRLQARTAARVERWSTVTPSGVPASEVVNDLPSRQYVAFAGSRF